MKERLLRFAAIGISVLLIVASVGVIFWIASDERRRLADREQAAIEAAAQASQQESQLATANKDAIDDAERIFHDIDTLLSGLATDDLPTED